MAARLFHIFRNNPLGRETLLQSIYFCNRVGATLVIYIPEHTKFLVYFENDAVQIDLDDSYLTSPQTALKHATELVEQNGTPASFLNPTHYTASTLPDIAPNFDFMSCPRSISDLTSKIGLGYLGPRVRRIINSARFPVLITSPAYKAWNSIAVLCGGSANVLNALKLGLRICNVTGMPLDIFTHLEKESKEFYEKLIEEKNMKKKVRRRINKWHTFEKGSFEENLYEIPHDALVVLGAYRHRLIKNIVLGGKMEKIQSTLPNNLLIAGPNYTEPNSSLPAWFPALG
ncbi:MAG: universal stress protein [Proteobacteria bacterium]|nr:universal stress protein [Pseudomonadota bacterium]